MRLGTITGGVKVRCSLCGMEVVATGPAEASKTLLAHLDRIHCRHPLLMDKQETYAKDRKRGDPPLRVEYTGPKWANDLAER